MPQKNKEITIRSSAAEYLTFIAAAGDNKQSFEMRYEDENIWLTQKMMALLYDVTVAAINQHIKKIFDDHELEPNSVIKNYLITAADGKNYNTIHYNKWANKIVKDYTIQGWAMVRVPMTMADWANHLDLILQADGNQLLKDAGKISAQIAENHALSEFEKYCIIQDKLFESDYDRFISGLEKLEEKTAK